MAKYSTLILFSAFLLLGAHCEREDENCHMSLYVSNTSQDSIYVARVSVLGSTGECHLGGEVLAPGKTKDYHYPHCWESYLRSKGTEDIYIVDPDSVNELGVFYPCDSIKYKNRILRHYRVDQNFLDSTNYRITFE